MDGMQRVWLRPSRILVGVDARTPHDLVAAIAPALAADVARAVPTVLDAVREGVAARAVSDGVALVQVELDVSPLGFLVVTRPAPGWPDVWVLVVTPAGDTSGRLQLLARAARLTQGPAVAQALRAAPSRDAAMAIVAAVEPTPAPTMAAPTRALVVAAIGGERAVDAILVRLVELGLDDAVLLEAQGAGEAVTREVPLFAGFRDLFGDPGGRRVLLVEVDAAMASEVIDAVQRACAAFGVYDAWAAAVPVLGAWRAPPPPDDRTEGG